MGRAVLMSLAPQYAAAAYAGTKRYEYRRCRTQIQRGDLVLLYESSPTKRVTGHFTVGSVKYGAPHSLSCLEDDPVIRDKVVAYLEGARCASALEIRRPRRLAASRHLVDLLGLRRPPQSYCFLEDHSDELLRHLEER